MTETAHAAIMPMPPEIATAIIAVKKVIETIDRDKTNPQGKYKYASVDHFYHEVRKPMADAGLFTILMETSAEVSVREVKGEYGTRSSSWLALEYDIYLFHASGASFGPIRRTVTVVASGPQAYGAAESFVTKYFLRNVFKIATGDPEIDDMQPSELPPNKEPAKISPVSFDSMAHADRLIADLQKITSRVDLRAWWRLSKIEFQKCDNADFERVRKAFSDHGVALPPTPKIGIDAGEP